MTTSLGFGSSHTHYTRTFVHTLSSRLTITRSPTHIHDTRNPIIQKVPMHTIAHTVNPPVPFIASSLSVLYAIFSPHYRCLQAGDAALFNAHYTYTHLLLDTTTLSLAITNAATLVHSYPLLRCFTSQALIHTYSHTHALQRFTHRRPAPLLQYPTHMYSIPLDTFHMIYSKYFSLSTDFGLSIQQPNRP